MESRWEHVTDMRAAERPCMHEIIDDTHCSTVDFTHQSGFRVEQEFFGQPEDLYP
jgi:hypothetical protein